MINILLGIAIVGVVFVSIAYAIESPFFAITIYLIVFLIWSSFRKNRQQTLIKNYHFPEELNEKISARYPHLSKENLIDVEQQLKHFFQIANACQPATVAMPSQVVDVAWHEFILHTREYHWFCHRAFGCYFHHHPFSKAVSSQEIQTSLQRTWLHSCNAENIDPEAPQRLPLIFSIDYSLKITDGNTFNVKDADKSTSDNTGAPKGSLECVTGSFAGVGAVALVAYVNSDNSGSVGGCGGGGCGGG